MTRDRNHHRPGLPALFLAALALLALPAQGQRAASPSGSDAFDAFRTIGDRNIFDPNRFPRQTRATVTEPVAPAEEVIAFVGTLQYEKGTYVFFDGSRPEYRQVLPVGGRIAEHTVTAIDAQSATFEGPSGPVTLRVTEQLRRSPGGTWNVSAASLPPPESPSAALGAAGARPAPSVPGNASDAVRRLMEKRQKQLKE